MNIRNARYLVDGRIDCEIEHPQFGWIPFTASADDPEEHGRAIFAAAQAGDVAAYVAATPAPTSQDVNRERDRRIAADFEFQGNMYQRDRVSLQRITGAATLAGFAVARGARTGDLEWAGNGAFGWIASDNTITPMDAHTCFAFGQAAAAVETRLIFAAKQLRGMDPIPADFADDKWWQ
jgi:hypothetical protein